MEMLFFSQKVQKSWSLSQKLQQTKFFIWMTGPCITNSYEVSIGSNICSCLSTQAIRPCIAHRDWGGFGGTCNARGQTLTMECVVGVFSSRKDQTLTFVFVCSEHNTRSDKRSNSNANGSD